MSAVSSQSSPDPRENPLAAQLALRHAEAVKSIEQALDGWFSVFGFTGTDCRTYEAATDDACHVVKLSPEYLNAEIDLRGDVPEQVLAALTNDVDDGNGRYLLVEEWEVRVDGSPLVLTAAMGKLAPRDFVELETFDEEIKIDERIINDTRGNPPEDKPFSPPKKSKKAPR